jgi:hypothetical protein
MENSVLVLPVSVEQIAADINQMSDVEQKRLLPLTPQLRQVAVSTPVRTKAQIEASVVTLQAEVLALLNHQPLSGDAPFLGNFTLDEYHALSDQEQARLWDELAGIDLLDLEEPEVTPDALPA